MDENLNTAAVPEDTTPQTETVEGDAPEVDPTPAENTNPEQPEGTTPEAAAAAEDPQTPVEPFLPVQFDHETIYQTREEATENSQLGLLYKKQKPMMDDLALMAAAQGKSTAEFIRALKEADEAALMEDKLNLTNGDREAAEILVKAEMDKRRAALGVRAKEEAEAEQKAEKDVTDRLAGEFVELQKEYPQLAEFANLPREVVEDAVRNQRHLLDAYLRYAHREAKKIEQNRTATEAASAASAGGMADHPPTGENPAIAAIDAGIRAVFG